MESQETNWFVARDGQGRWSANASAERADYAGCDVWQVWAETSAQAIQQVKDSGASRASAILRAE